jgi:hypothetical protein
MESLLVEKRKVMPLWVHTRVPKWYNVFSPVWAHALLDKFGHNPSVYNIIDFERVSPEFLNMFYMLSTMFHQVDHTVFNWHMHSKMLCSLAHSLCVNYGVSPHAFPTVQDMIFWAMAKVTLPDMLDSVCYKFLIACNYKIPFEIISIDLDPYRFYKFTVDPVALVDKLVGST